MGILKIVSTDMHDQEPTKSFELTDIKKLYFQQAEDIYYPYNLMRLKMEPDDPMIIVEKNNGIKYQFNLRRHEISIELSQCA